MKTPIAKPIVFAVVGYKKTGKTTLVGHLVSEFKDRGYRVGTIKHDVHDFQMDYPGTDTFKHREAGADAVAIGSASRWVLQVWPEEKIVLQELLAHMPDMEIVIVEGYKQEDLPKIVIADQAGAIFQNERLSNVVLIAAEGGTALLAPAGVDVYDKNDAVAIADYMLKTLK